MPDFQLTHYPDAEYLFNALRFSGKNPDEGIGQYYLNVRCYSSLKRHIIGAQKVGRLALVVLVLISINLVIFPVMVTLPYWPSPFGSASKWLHNVSLEN